MGKKLKECKKEYVLYGLLACTTLFLIIFPGYGNDHWYWVYRLEGMVHDLQMEGIGALPTRVLSNSFYGYGYGAPLFYSDLF